MKLWVLEYEWNDYDDNQRIEFGVYTSQEKAEAAKQEVIDRVVAHVTRTEKMKRLWEERPHRNVKQTLRAYNDPLVLELRLEHDFRRVDELIDSIYIYTIEDTDLPLFEDDVQLLLGNLWFWEGRYKEDEDETC